MTPEVNVLVAATRPGYEHHVTAVPLAQRHAIVVVAGVTHHRVFLDRDPVQVAVAFADALMENPVLEPARPATIGPRCETN